MFLQKRLDRVDRKGKVNWRERVPQARAQQAKKLRSITVENELILNLDDSAEQVLDEQMEKGFKMGRLCLEILTQGMKNKISFSSKV